MQRLTVFFSISLFCLSITLLSGCDWRLRGSGTDYAASKVFLDTSGRDSGDLSVYREVYSMLMNQQALASREQADIQLVIVKQSFNRRTISVNKNARAAEFQLTLKVPFNILGKAGVVLRKSTAVSTRSYRFNEQDIVGKNKEEALLKREMVTDIAHQILRQL